MPNAHTFTDSFSCFFFNNEQTLAFEFHLAWIESWRRGWGKVDSKPSIRSRCTSTTSREGDFSPSSTETWELHEKFAREEIKKLLRVHKKVRRKSWIFYRLRVGKDEKLENLKVVCVWVNIIKAATVCVLHVKKNFFRFFISCVENYSKGRWEKSISSTLRGWILYQNESFTNWGNSCISRFF